LFSNIVWRARGGFAGAFLSKDGKACTEFYCCTIFSTSYCI